MATTGCVTGAHAQGETLDAERTLEAMLGKKFGLIRVYDFWNGPPVNQQDIQRIVAENRMVLVSHKANRDRRQGPLVPWASIAAGTEDAVVAGQADFYKSLTGPAGASFEVWYVFHHEPHNDEEYGTATQFADAFRRVVDVFRDRLATNVKFAFCATGSALDSEEDLAGWYPGDDWIDMLAPDRYNWWTYKPGGSVDNPVWEPFPLLFEKILSVARSHGKPIVVGEWASHPSVNTTDKSRPEWLREAAAYMRAHPEFVGYCYYHSKPERTGNDWRLTEADRAGYDAFVNDAYFLSMPRSAAV